LCTFVAVKTTVTGSLYVERSFSECFHVARSKHWSSRSRTGKRRQNQLPLVEEHITRVFNCKAIVYRIFRAAVVCTYIICIWIRLDTQNKLARYWNQYVGDQLLIESYLQMNSKTLQVGYNFHGV